MITDLNKILVEWAYRTNDGQPNSKNSAHVIILEKVLNDFGWSREAIAELLNNLMVDKKEKKSNIWQTKSGNWRGERPDGTRRSYKDKDKTKRWVSGEEFEDEEDDEGGEDI